MIPILTGFTVSPGNKWFLESGRTYEIGVEVFDRDRRRIHLSDVSYIFCFSVFSWPFIYYELLVYIKIARPNALPEKWEL